MPRLRADRAIGGVTDVKRVKGVRVKIIFAMGGGSLANPET